MQTSISTLLAVAAISSSLAAQSFPLPVTATSSVATENTAPFDVPTRMTQTLITNRNTLIANGLNPSLTNWDMATFDPSGRYIFVPCENFGGGGGVFRYDTQTGTHIEIFTGNGLGVATRNSDPATFDHTTDETAANDPCSWSPWGTIVFGEETTGGRFFECTNPLSPNGPFNVVWHAGSIPAVRHEGMRFDSAGNLYFIDESNSGSIYKFVPTTYGDLSSGQTFVLSIDAYAADPNAVPNENFNSASNQLTTRVGQATWVAMTDVNGAPLTPTNPFTYVTVTSGQAAADEVFATPFGRPEDIDIGVLANGNDVVYAALTSENRVISIELQSATTAMVRDFVNYDTINFATGLDVNPTQSDPFTSPGSDPDDNFDDPDNIAIGPNGAIYILEDEDPGDIWKAIDADNDGVAEGIGIFVSLTVAGSEPTGMMFDPTNPYRFICNIQHPASGNDALWAFESRPYAGSDLDLRLSSGIDAVPHYGAGEFVRDVEPLETITLRVDSLSGSLYGQPYAILLQPFDTAVGQPMFLPPLWLNPFVQSFALTGGYVGQFQQVLPYGPASIAVMAPPGLAGISIMAQAVCVDQGGALVLTDGHEVVFK